MPYKRITYFTERITQWALCAPPIEEDDERAIFDWYSEHEQQLAISKAQWASPIESKEIIRHILAAVDEQIVADGERPRFVRKYFEKWLTLRHDLSGWGSEHQYVCDEQIAQIRYMFSRAEGIFEEHFKRDAGRHSFLNYNFVTRRLLELAGAHWASCDWPPLKTPSKQLFLVMWWRRICKVAGWPYVNFDRETFPSVQFYK